MRPSQKLNTFSSMIFLMKKNDILHKNSDKYTLSSEESAFVSGGTVPVKVPRAVALEPRFINALIVTSDDS
uniref:Uncharacterized protein n=1 Tax=Pseudoalteromonas citrea DSM 8771 TaxID=1117314 RepID=U1KWX9_9GAMM